MVADISADYRGRRLSAGSAGPTCLNSESFTGRSEGVHPRRESKTLECGCDRPGGGLWSIDSDDQFGVVLVTQADCDRLVRVLDVPERPLAMVDITASGDDSRKVGADDTQSVPNLVRFGYARVDTSDVLKGHFELTFESEETICPTNVNDEAAGGDLYVCHLPAPALYRPQLRFLHPDIAMVSHDDDWDVPATIV